MTTSNWHDDWCDTYEQKKQKHHYHTQWLWTIQTTTTTSYTILLRGGTVLVLVLHLFLSGIKGTFDWRALLSMGCWLGNTPVETDRPSLAYQYLALFLEQGSETPPAQLNYVFNQFTWWLEYPCHTESCWYELFPTVGGHGMVICHHNQSNRQTGRQQAWKSSPIVGDSTFFLEWWSFKWYIFNQVQVKQESRKTSKQASKVRLLMFSHNQILWAQVEKVRKLLVVTIITLNCSSSTTRGARAKKMRFLGS